MMEIFVGQKGKAMKMLFEHDEVQAVENFIADTQYRIQLLMEEKNVRMSDLAKLLGVSKARVSQMFGDRPNLTLAMVARIFHALKERPKLTCESLNSLIEAVARADYANDAGTSKDKEWAAQSSLNYASIIRLIAGAPIYRMAHDCGNYDHAMPPLQREAA